MNAAIRAAVWANFSSEVQARGGYHGDEGTMGTRI